MIHDAGDQNDSRFHHKQFVVYNLHVDVCTVWIFIRVQVCVCVCAVEV